MSEIIVDPEILAGKPIIKGTRISVELVLDFLASGTSVEDLLREYPQLTRESVLAALQYAAKAIRHEEVLAPS